MWQSLATALCLVLVIEGLMPFLPRDLEAHAGSCEPHGRASAACGRPVVHADGYGLSVPDPLTKLRF